MDLKDELRGERERRIQLERELEFWHNSQITKIDPEILAQAIQTQQIETLTYHLMKQRQLASDLDTKLKAKEKELELAVENIKNLEKQLEEKPKNAETAKRVPEPPKRPPEPAPAGLKFGTSWIPSDDELDTILSQTPAGPSGDRRQGIQQETLRTKRDTKTFRDFIQLVRRMERLKLYDAALLMDTNQDDVLIWARALERKGYLVIQGLREKTIVATDKMLKTR
jgi:hypothetical protein